MPKATQKTNSQITNDKRNPITQILPTKRQNPEIENNELNDYETNHNNDQSKKLKLIIDINASPVSKVNDDEKSNKRTNINEIKSSNNTIIDNIKIRELTKNELISNLVLKVVTILNGIFNLFFI